jgi:hypothetical protein
MTSADDRTGIEWKWRKIASDARDEAKSMPPCAKRDDLLKKARQLEVAASPNSWLSSPDLRE